MLRTGGRRTGSLNCQASVGNEALQASVKVAWADVCDVRSCASNWGYSQRAITFMLNEQGLRNFIRILGLQRSSVQQS